MATTPGERLRVAGLFAGIGGIELGLERAGHQSEILCEIEPGARAVLAKRFQGVHLESDVRRLKTLPPVDLVAAGFPCQDLSQAGRTAGIKGNQSGLVQHLFRLLDSSKRVPRWLLIENVSFMLQLDRGQAMRYLVDQLEERGFAWAYRVVDTRAFGLPQRRQRVILLASRTEDPREALLGQDSGGFDEESAGGELFGFYWTEGTRGLGWAVDAVPTLKGGSTVGIPSPPAIWDPRDDSISTPEIRDAERLQGFEPDWTLPALDADGVRASHRWKLVGNAVSVPIAEWIGRQLARATKRRWGAGAPLSRGVPWPRSAWGHRGKVFTQGASMFPMSPSRSKLGHFLRFPRVPLSFRAASGFLSRARESSLTFQPGFLDGVSRHIDRMRASVGG
jgi:DNA (cytosine-5)-methyltransferase 1